MVAASPTDWHIPIHVEQLYREFTYTSHSRHYSITANRATGLVTTVTDTRVTAHTYNSCSCLTYVWLSPPVIELVT